MRKLIVVAVVLFMCGVSFAGAQSTRQAWHAATSQELQALLPPRAPVVHERIETEMRAASGITNGRGKYIAGVVLITAGYSANGKYSHFFVTQVPLTIAGFVLQPGSYLIGWNHKDDALDVKFYESSSGLFLGSVKARLNPSIHRVESIRIWPPSDHSVIQIGRFTFPYHIGD